MNSQAMINFIMTQYSIYIYVHFIYFFVSALGALFSLVNNRINIYAV